MSFFNKPVSHHNCYASWKKDGLTYTLLHQDRKDDGFSIFTMVRNEFFHGYKVETTYLKVCYFIPYTY